MNTKDKNREYSRAYEPVGQQDTESVTEMKES